MLIPVMLASFGCRESDFKRLLRCQRCLMQSLPAIMVMITANSSTQPSAIPRPNAVFLADVLANSASFLYDS